MSRKLTLQLKRPLGIPMHSREGHFYQSPTTLKIYPSVTGRLAHLANHSQRNWRKNRTLDYIRDNFHQMTKENLAEHLKLAWELPESLFKQAGNTGTETHDWREIYFKRLMRGNTNSIVETYKKQPRKSSEVLSTLIALERFVADTGYKPLLCEIPMVSDRLEVGGSLDDAGLLNGELILLDVKTSNQISASYYFQVGIYAEMFKETYGRKPKRLYILKLSKTDGTYLLHEIQDAAKTIKTSIKFLQVANELDKINELIKPKRQTFVLNV